MTPHRSQFRQYSDWHSDSIRVGNSQHCAIIGIGKVELNLPGGSTLVDIPVSSLWHRLGHLSKAGITHLSRAGYIPKLSFSNHQFCEHCQYGKQVAASHPTSAPRESSPLDLVHSDVFGPMPHQSLGGASYFVSFIDDLTRKVWAYTIRTKDRVFSIFSEWLAMVENQTGRKLKCLRTDNEGEFKSDEFVKFCRNATLDRTVGWLLARGSTQGSRHNQHVAK